MTSKEILALYAASAKVKSAIKELFLPKRKTFFFDGLHASSAPTVMASIFQGTPSTVLIVMQDSDEAGYFYNDMRSLAGAECKVLMFPSSYRRAVKYGQLDDASIILRTEVLSALSAEGGERGQNASPVFVVTCPEALSELVVSKKIFDEHNIILTNGQTTDLTLLQQQLREIGFKEVDYVYEPGQFATRGSILDVYSYSCELPFRIDFFGDEIDSIRTFEVEDQLSKEHRQRVEIVPALARMEEEKIPFMDFLPETTFVACRDMVFVSERIDNIFREGFSTQALNERLEGATEPEQRQIMQEMQRDSQLICGQKFREAISRFKRIDFGQHPTDTPETTIRFDITPQPLLHKNVDLLRTTVGDYRKRGYRLCLMADSKKQIERIKEILCSEGNSVIDASEIQSTPFTLHEGYVDNSLKICFFTDHQIFDRFHKYNLQSDKARNGKIALTMKELQELEYGDFLVHVDFGIGKFGGLVRVPLPKYGKAAEARNDASGEEQAYQEMIRIVYQRGDIVDVSIHSLYKISKYRSSGDGQMPRLSTLGTGVWERMKERTKKRIKDIARDLIQLYAKRQQAKGFAYSPDSFMQHELEASFLYEDTPDQLKATNDVKADMESSSPMDRLVCGDVGFGKTEVAVRAAFKAACDSKQVAVLVPTTVLAFQHYQTFRDRLQNLPVRVDYLSRARSAKQVKQLLADLKEGKVDILVGTHKLIGKQVEWKDLGLLIIDEEQKFGVAVKEKLRKLKTNVDTLTMSATPIPRTLQFSLMGARDMSIIRTPPPNRYPIQTEVATYNSETIADAINFEMSRNGQVFFVNSRISNLTEIEMLIKKHVPDCRVVIGHGQMKPEELERVIMGFINYDYDVLLSTTIVENGIDIPNANTIIINDAHKFGLSDLHQMRGRVGRSNRKAFCYLLSPPKALLPADARRRLEAIETFSDLGSGFNLAMQDLDIRGAGNLLGAEQSGFMEDLGYETYLKIIKQAMVELRNENRDEELQRKEEGSGAVGKPAADALNVMGDSIGFVDDCALECDLEMYFPDTYVPTSSERMLLYRELDSIETDEQLEAYRQRLEDRFGKVPRQGEELMQVVALRRIGKQLGCEKVILRQGRMQLQFVSNADSPYYQSSMFERVINYVGMNVRKCSLKEIGGRRLMSISDVLTVGDAVSVLREIRG